MLRTLSLQHVGMSLGSEGKVAVSMVSTRRTYPAITTKAWWQLRKQFRQSVPAQVTARYLATVLETKEKSAEANVLLGVRAVGLIDKDGTPTPRANDWRDDERYAQTCKAILEEIYPQDLRDAVPNPSSAGDAAEGWFMRTTGCGQSAARKMASLYSLLAAGDPSADQKRTARKPTPTTGSGSNGKQRARTLSSPTQLLTQRQSRPPASPDPEMPEMRLNLEIRIDASVTPEQIDQIFASMAKHIYRRGDEK